MQRIISRYICTAFSLTFPVPPKNPRPADGKSIIFNSKHTHQCKIFPVPMHMIATNLCGLVFVYSARACKLIPDIFFPCHLLHRFLLPDRRCLPPPDKIFGNIPFLLLFFRCDYRNQLKCGWHCLIPRDQAHLHRMDTVCTVNHNRSECQESPQSSSKFASNVTACASS